MCADAVDDETVAVSEALVTDMIKAGAVAGGTGHFNSLGLCDLRDSSAPSFFLDDLFEETCAQCKCL